MAALTRGAALNQRWLFFSDGVPMRCGCMPDFSSQLMQGDCHQLLPYDLFTQMGPTCAEPVHCKTHRWSSDRWTQGLRFMTLKLLSQIWELQFCLSYSEFIKRCNRDKGLLIVHHLLKVKVGLYVSINLES